MLDAGVFENPNRLELLHGVIVEKPVKSPSTWRSKRRVSRVAVGPWPGASAHRGLRSSLRTGSRCRSPTSRSSKPASTLTAHPATALLVVEIAKTSLKVDTTIKPPIYAVDGRA